MHIDSSTQEYIVVSIMPSLALKTARKCANHLFAEKNLLKKIPEKP